MATDAQSIELPKKLRFAVMCAGSELPAAHARCVEEVLAVKGVELALLIVETSSPIKSSSGLQRRPIFPFTNLWTLHARSLRDQRLPYHRPVEMSRVFASVSTVNASQFGEFNQFRPEDIASIGQYDLDFILRFSHGVLRGDILKAARYGVWAFHYGDETRFPGPAAFWEIYHGVAVTGANLHRLTDDPPDRVWLLQKGFIATRRASHEENLDAIMWATTYMPARVCRDIFQDRASYLKESPKLTLAPTFRTPTDFEMLWYLLTTTLTWLKKQFQSIFFLEDWNVGVVTKPVHKFLDHDFRPTVQWLAYKRNDAFLADPFLLKVGSRLKLLAEEFDYHINRGYIVEGELKNNGRTAPSFRKVLDEGVHMSYPFLFEHKGISYCMPEAALKRGVFLYVFSAEDERLTPAATLISDFAAVDPTILEYRGRWWLFCTNLDDEALSKLFLWHAPTLLGPWEPHAANPVKMDVRSSRPAGRPFLFEGQLYRPAQDCSMTYGGGVTINKVTALTTQEFSEEPAVRIAPIWKSPYRAGIHTLDCKDSITVIDGKRLVFAPKFAMHRIKHKLRKLGAQEE